MLEKVLGRVQPTNVAADKHFWIARYARIVRCACRRNRPLGGKHPIRLVAPRRLMIIRVRIRTVLSALLVLGVFPVACHKNAGVHSDSDVGRVISDTARVVPIRDTSVIAFFKDTTVVSIFLAERQNFRLPAQLQFLRATLKKERELWQAGKPREYRFLLRVGCFCPGTQGWLLIEVRDSKPVRAWDRAGRPAPLTDWNTFSIDGLYDNLERTARNDGEVEIAFDPRWHFPRFVHTVALPGPDAWSTIEVRGLRPI